MRKLRGSVRIGAGYSLPEAEGCGLPAFRAKVKDALILAIVGIPRAGRISMVDFGKCYRNPGSGVGMHTRCHHARLEPTLTQIGGHLAENV